MSDERTKLEGKVRPSIDQDRLLDILKSLVSSLQNEDEEGIAFVTESGLYNLNENMENITHMLQEISEVLKTISGHLCAMRP